MNWFHFTECETMGQKNTEPLTLMFKYKFIQENSVVVVIYCAVYSKIRIIYYTVHSEVK